MVSSIPRPPHPQWNQLFRQYSGCRYDIEELHMQSVISKMRGNSWSKSHGFQEMVLDLLRRPRKTIWNESPGFVVLVDATRPLKWDINTCNKIAIFWTTQYVDCPPRNYFHAGIVRQERPQKCNRFIMISIYSESKYETNVMGHRQRKRFFPAKGVASKLLCWGNPENPNVCSQDEKSYVPPICQIELWWWWWWW